METRLPANTSSKSRDPKPVRSTARIHDITGRARVGRARTSRRRHRRMPQSGSQTFGFALVEANISVLLPHLIQCGLRARRRHRLCQIALLDLLGHDQVVNADAASKWVSRASAIQRQQVVHRDSLTSQEQSGMRGLAVRHSIEVSHGQSVQKHREWTGEDITLGPEGVDLEVIIKVPKVLAAKD